MLRTIVAVVGVLLLCAGVALVIAPPHAGWGYLIFGGLIVLSLIFEGRYRAARVRGPASSSFEPTGEKFIDPGTGKVVEVYYDPKTGEREYR